MAPTLPAGTVTLLFTGIEGSTALLHRLGDAYGNVLADHHRVLRDGRYWGQDVHYAARLTLTRIAGIAAGLTRRGRGAAVRASG